MNTLIFDRIHQIVKIVVSIEARITNKYNYSDVLLLAAQLYEAVDNKDRAKEASIKLKIERYIKMINLA